LDSGLEKSGDLAQVLELLRWEMERAQTLTREFESFLKPYARTQGELPAEGGPAAKFGSVVEANGTTACLQFVASPPRMEIRHSIVLPKHFPPVI
jgi:hypothetical protein